MSELVSFDGCGRRRRTHCKNGHLYDEKTSSWSINWKGYRCRECRECSRLRQARKRENPEFNRLSAERTARWRQRHPEKYETGWKQAQGEKRQILLGARVGGCVKCGEKDPACLDFHHRNGKADKLGHIGVIRRFGLSRLHAEIAKCDILCANCHRKHHRDERNKKEVT
mgnify:CR=1 FL=1